MRELILDIYARLLNAGVSMRDIDNMDITRYFQVLAREAEHRDEHDTRSNGKGVTGNQSFDWDALPRVNIDQVKGF